jgi:alpha-tubulin suppressor-like RCC1 family protein
MPPYRRPAGPRRREPGRRVRGRAGLAAVAALVGAGALAATSGAAFVTTGDVRSTLGAVAAVPLVLPGGISAGYGYSLGWDADGVLHGWGANVHGQLGTGTPGAEHRPLAALLPEGLRVVDAAAGVTVSVAVTADGGVWTWGNPGVGTNGPTPVRHPFFDTLDEPVVGVDAGGYFYLAWTSSGALYSWGVPGARLGQPATATDDPPARVTAQGLDARAVSSASAGRYHGAAVVDGDVVTWGTGFGEHAGATLTGLAPGRTAEVSAGSGVTLVRSVDGTVATARSVAAEPVPGLEGVVGAAASTPMDGESAFWAWDATGTVRAWGQDVGGHLGLGTPGASHAAPVPVAMPAGVEVVAVVAGGDHALHVTATGEWAAAGANAAGQHGDGGTTPTATVVRVRPADRWP